MIRRRHVVLVGLLSIAAFVMGCEDNPVGRLCDIGTATPTTDETVVASQSLDCVSRTCLRVPLGREVPPGGEYPPVNSGLCTAECSTDSDCDRVPESPCVTGFTCGIPPGITVGDFCCKKFCVCKDYVVIPESGELPTPVACNPDDARNECCNLEGRVGNPEYPRCRG
jgi:hypothetical protein